MVWCRIGTPLSSKMDRNSAIELVSEDEIETEKGNRDRSPRSCCSTICLVVAVLIFISSFFLLLIMIPISLRIEDRAAVGASLLRLNTSSNVLLAKVDALWHWEVIAETINLTATESIILFIVPVDKTNEVWVNYTMLGEDHIAYALSGSVISSEGQFSIVSVLDNVDLCTSCSTYQIIENGYYKVQNSSVNSVRYNLRYVDNSANGTVMCTLQGWSDHKCELKFDKIEPYNVIAKLYSTHYNAEEPITVQLSENGRRTWYFLFVLLVLPIIFSAISLVITIICVRLNFC